MSDSEAEDDLWRAVSNAMNEPSSPLASRTPAPAQRGHKRTAAQAELPSDDEDASSSAPGTPNIALNSAARPPNKNLLAVARRVGTQKKLRPDLAREVEDFATDLLSTQNIKLYATMVSINAKLDKINASAPPFQVSKDSELWTNLVSYSNAVFFSSKLAAYKGPIGLNHVLDIVKRMRFGIPAGLEHNTANWNKIINAIQGILTQIRGAVKKEIKKSINVKGALEKPWSIYKLTEKLLHGTGCKVTVPVMARVALMRNIYQRHPDTDFWDAIDKRLSKIRKHAGKDADTPEKLTRAFKLILDKDRSTYGSDAGEPDIDETATDDLQQTVDEGIERSVQQGGAEEEGGGNDPDEDALPSAVASDGATQSQPASGRGSDAGGGD